MRGRLLGDGKDAAAVDKAYAKCSHVGWRAREELNLLQKQWLSIAGATALLLWGTMVVFLNLAFYRYAQHYGGPGGDIHRLQDLGYDVFPQMDTAYEKFVDVPLILMLGITGVILAGLFTEGRPAPDGTSLRLKPHAVNVLRRGLICLAAGHVLRAFTYLSTTLPGTAEHCLQREELEPPTLAQCFYRPASVTTNCGDLVFSGHMLLFVLMVCTVKRYGGVAWQLSLRMHVALFAFSIALALAQACLILASRHHYTVDVVIAAYLTPMIWCIYDVYMPPEAQPDRAAIARRVLAGSTVNPV